MTTMNFFRNMHNKEPSFFYEGPRTSIDVDLLTVQNSSSIATIEIDGYRQGVELTQQKHFDAGLAKIHAGEPGHALRKNNFGQDKYRPGTLLTSNGTIASRLSYAVFQDKDYFSPQSFIIAQDSQAAATSFFSTVTYPIITADNDSIDNYIFNGVIEPLTIRSKASFFSIDIPFEAHDVHGALMAGNTDATHGSDRVQTIYKYDLKQRNPYFDTVADQVPIPVQPITGSRAPAVAMGIFPVSGTRLAPFNDIVYSRNVMTSSVYDIDMAAALLLMSGSTDDYLHFSLGEKSAACGWEYSNNFRVGTDSLAFGGMIY